MNLDQRIDLARAALMEFGRPDLAGLISSDGTRATAPWATNSEDERAYYKACEIVMHSQGKKMVCLHCWRRFFRNEVTTWPECDHR